MDELFRLLFIKECNALNEILPALFEKTNDYTELLLSISVIDKDGVVYHLVNDIPEEDFDVEKGGQVEIIELVISVLTIQNPKLRFLGAHLALRSRKKIYRQRLSFLLQTGLFVIWWKTAWDVYG